MDCDDNRFESLVACRPIVAEQQCGEDDWLVYGDKPLEIARLVRNFYRDHTLPIAVLKAAILVERAYRS